MEYAIIKRAIFFGKQKIPWNEVETYTHRYDGMIIINQEYGDNIIINSSFADEYVHSEYTKKLRGGLAKVKANLAQVIPEIVENATNRRWIANKNNKHKGRAARGWYRYDVYFEMRVQDPSGSESRMNRYVATAVVRINDMGLFLYDIINIKKEARKPTDH